MKGEWRIEERYIHVILIKKYQTVDLEWTYEGLLDHNGLAGTWGTKEWGNFLFNLYFYYLLLYFLFFIIYF